MPVSLGATSSDVVTSTGDGDGAVQPFLSPEGHVRTGVEQEEDNEASVESLERVWLLQTECKSTLQRVRATLESLSLTMQDGEGTRAQPLRAGLEEEHGLRFAAAVTGCALEAASVQFKLPKWNRGLPYRAVLAANAQIVLHPLVTMRNKVAQALQAFNSSLSSLMAVHAVVSRLTSLLADVLRAFSQQAPLQAPSNASLALTQQLQATSPAMSRSVSARTALAPRTHASAFVPLPSLLQVRPSRPGPALQSPSDTPAVSCFPLPSQPPPPPELFFEASICGSPVELYVSAFLLRAGSATAADAAKPPAVATNPVVTEVRHASVQLESVAGALRDIEHALNQCRLLNLKIEAFM